MSFKKGHYKTRCGFPAVVAQVKAVGMTWVLRGAIEIQGALYMHHWTIGGHSDTCGDLDLVKNK